MSDYQRGRNNNAVEGSLDVMELMVAREIEKRKIKEEILASGILIRWELEDKVISEMMLERQIELQMRMEQRTSLINLTGGIEGMPPSMDRTGAGIYERLNLMNGSEDGGFGRIPFQLEPGATSAAAVKPVIGLGKGKALSLSMPVNPIAAGVKRKFETPVAAGGNEIGFSSRTKESHEWSCALCQVTATSEQQFEAHLNGRKHKAKGKALLQKTKLAGHSVDDCALVTEETGKHDIPTCSISPNQGSKLDEVQNANNTVFMGSDQCAEKLESKNDLDKQERAKKDMPKNFKFCNEIGFSSRTKKLHEWRCALCQINATSEKGSKAHLNGREQKKKELFGQTKSAGKNVDVFASVSEETVKFTEHDVPNCSISPKQGHELDEMQNSENTEFMGSEQHAKKLKSKIGLDDQERAEEDVPKNFKFWCSTCNVGTHSAALMTAHRIGKEPIALLNQNFGGVIAIKTMPKNMQYIEVTREVAAKAEKELAQGDEEEEANNKQFGVTQGGTSNEAKQEKGVPEGDDDEEEEVDRRGV